jgi:hypothetical protein
MVGCAPAVETQLQTSPSTWFPGGLVQHVAGSAAQSSVVHRTAVIERATWLGRCPVLDQCHCLFAQITAAALQHVLFLRTSRRISNGALCRPVQPAAQWHRHQLAAGQHWHSMGAWGSSKLGLCAWILAQYTQQLTLQM